MVGIFDLPHPEIWAEDTEYYPGRGLGNGGVEGDSITPLCRVAIELRTAALFGSGKTKWDLSLPITATH